MYLSSNKNYLPPTKEEILDNRKEDRLPCWISSIIYLLGYPYFSKFCDNEKKCQICRKYCGKTTIECSNDCLNTDITKLSPIEKNSYLQCYEIIKCMYDNEIEYMDEFIEQKKEVIKIKNEYNEKKKILQDM